MEEDLSGMALIEKGDDASEPLRKKKDETASARSAYGEKRDELFLRPKKMKTAIYRPTPRDKQSCYEIRESVLGQGSTH